MCEQPEASVYLRGKNRYIYIYISFSSRCRIPRETGSACSCVAHLPCLSSRASGFHLTLRGYAQNFFYGWLHLQTDNCWQLLSFCFIFPFCMPTPVAISPLSKFCGFSPFLNQVGAPQVSWEMQSGNPTKG